MKLISRMLKLIVLSIVILLVVLGAAFYLFGEYILEIGIETAATKALGVGVDIADVDLSILKGTVEIDGLTVKNPDGYAHKHLFKLSKGRITTDIGSLLNDIVHIEEIKLDGIDLVIEQKALSNNLKDVISSLPAKDKQKPKLKKEAKKLRVNNLEITNVKVEVKLLPLPGKSDTVTLNLAPIRMSNLGDDNQLTTGGLSKKIIVAIAEGISEQGADTLPKEMVNTIKAALDKTIDLGEAALKKGKKLIDTGKDAGGELVEGFKSLLKPKKKNK